LKGPEPLDEEKEESKSKESSIIKWDWPCEFYYGGEVLEGLKALDAIRIIL
jgi:hypothetical protein